MSAKKKRTLLRGMTKKELSEMNELTLDVAMAKEACRYAEKLQNYMNDQGMTEEQHALFSKINTIALSVFSQKETLLRMFVERKVQERIESLAE